MGEDVIVPVVMFAAIPVIFWLVFYFRYRTRAEMQQTVRLAIEKGNQLTPELIAQLGDPEPDKNRDLRRGLIWISLAVGLGLCGYFVPDPSGDALRGCLAGAAFPFAIGIAYMIMWRYGVAQEAKESAAH